MSTLSSIARSGMTAAQARVEASAGNIANLQTPQYRRQQVLQAEAAGGGATTTLSRAGAAAASADGNLDKLATDLIQQKSAAYEFKANLRVLQTGQELLGSLLDTHA